MNKPNTVEAFISKLHGTRHWSEHTPHTCNQTSWTRQSTTEKISDIQRSKKPSFKHLDYIVKKNNTVDSRKFGLR